MAWEIGFVDNTTELAHYAMLKRLRDKLIDPVFMGVGQAWTTLRFDESQANHEWIAKAPGLSGTEEIFLGIRTYQNADADFFNLAVAAFTGFVSGNTFDTQPAALLSGVPAHNQRIDYWLSANGQRVNCVMKVGTPVYEHFGLGKMLPYATPNQWPYPVLVSGMLNGVPNTRFSETTHSFGWKGNKANFRLRGPAGTWMQPEAWPWNQANSGSEFGAAVSLSATLRTTNSQYSPLPIEINDATNVWGSVDGVFYLPGFDQVVETILQMGGTPVDPTGLTDSQLVAAIIAAGGRAFVALQDVARTGFADYIAMELA